MNSRRKFLQNITASVIAIPFLSKNEYLESFKDINDKSYDGPVLRVAIMGLGSYGTRVADAMKDCTKAKLVGVISGTPSKIKAWQAKYNIPEKNCYNYENYDNIKNNPDIDAVYIITPNALHKERRSEWPKLVNMLFLKNQCRSMLKMERKWSRPVKKQM